MARPAILGFFFAAFISLLLAGRCALAEDTSTFGGGSSAAGGECVILVHGLWRSGFAMRPLARPLEELGYRVEAPSYPSTNADITEAARDYLKPAVDACRPAGKAVHLVSHSMGGIVVRAYLQEERLPVGSRVVMLSPPNQGSEIIRYFGDQDWFLSAAGPAASSLSQSARGIIPTLKPFPEPVGIVAAYRDWSLWPDAWLPAPNDGMVSVDSMRLEGMDDFVLVRAGHASMRYRDEVQAQIVNFLQYGRFKKEQTARWVEELPALPALSIARPPQGAAPYVD